MPSDRLTHHETHFGSSDTVRDVVIGMADGLTVPFALAAGLTGAVTASRLVITAGFAEIAAGSIAMGLGGYLAAKSDREHYLSEQAREYREIEDVPDEEAAEVDRVLEKYGLEDSERAIVVGALRRTPDAWVDFMMRFELGLEEPDPKRALRSALTIAGSYIVGGLAPLSPYFFTSNAIHALIPSCVITLLALLAFGYFKARVTGASPIKSALQTALVGGLAAGAAFGIAKLIQH